MRALDLKCAAKPRPSCTSLTNTEKKLVRLSNLSITAESTIIAESTVMHD